MDTMQSENKKGTHRAVVRWDKERKVFLCSIGKNTLEIAESVECKKREGIWTPEELFVASIEGFLKNAFIDQAKKSNFDFLKYESKAKGAITKAKGKLAFSEIEIRPRIAVSSNRQIEKAIELIELAEKVCFKSDFITAKITVCPEIRIGL